MAAALAVTVIASNLPFPPTVAASPGPPLELEALGADLALFGQANGILSFTGNGRSMATCDLNGDEIDDLLAAMVTGGGPGGAVVVYGTTTAPAGSLRDLGQGADVTIRSPENAFGTGTAVACGDVNGDGRNDIVLGANSACHGDPLDCGGAVYVVYGNAPWPAVIDLAGSPPDLTVWGKTTLSDGLSHPDSLGSALGVGDVNGDFIDDIAMGALGSNGPNNDRGGASGAVYMIYGGTDLPSLIDLAIDVPGFAFYGEEGGDAAGSSVAVHDLDGDGFADLIVGAGGDGPGNSRPGAGEAYVVYGSAALPLGVDVLGEVGPAPDVRIYGGQGGISLGDALGASLAVCDVNNDGENDLLIGARRGGGQVGRPQAGAVYIFYGGSLSAVLDVVGEVGPGANAVIWGANGSGTFGDDLLGHQLACGDVNGDGIADILAVAERGDAPFQRPAEGAIYVYYGSATLPAVMDIREELGRGPDVILYTGGGPANTMPPMLKVASGDVNGDGIDELIAGAPLTSIPVDFGSIPARELGGAVFVFNIPRLAALDPPPVATRARYVERRRKRLKITVPGATGDEVLEINGRLVGPWWQLRRPIVFKPDKSQFVVKGSRAKLFLSPLPGANTVVIIKDGLRSAPLFF